MKIVLSVALLVAAASPAFAGPTVDDPGAPEKAADSGDRMVCKRFTRTGSLVATYKTCKTKHEWERERINLSTLGVSDACRNRAEPDPTRLGGGCNY